ncbi:diacylglycerol/lipid kinase family protein [Tessaracoccus sp.]
MRELAKPRLYTLVVNEGSGGGRSGRELPKVARALRDCLPTAEVQVIASSSWTDAEKLTRTAALQARDGDAVLVMGGDGMAHLGLNACAGTQATLGIIPAGTGNDFARGVGVPKNLPQAVDAICVGATRRVDLSHVSNEAYPSRYVGAVMSTGYDARVNRATNDISLRFGSLSYGWIAMRELIHFSPLQYRLRIDGVLRIQEAMIVAVCNTGMFGGGMRVAPEADPTDGMLDVTIVDPVSRSTLLRLLPQMYSGKFVRHPSVQQFRAREVEIAGDGLFCMGDGEELGDVPVTVKAAPGVLKVFVDAAHSVAAATVQA